ncbi:MAG: hypothetical protein U0271_01580 [Polyangiaceae bacterium]
MTSSQPSAVATGQAAPTPSPKKRFGGNFSPPAGMTWLDEAGGRLLAGKFDAEEVVECEVWDAAKRKKVGDVDLSAVAAGGSETGCDSLSPDGRFVRVSNSRQAVYRAVEGHLEVDCGFATFGPDGASCIDSHVNPFPSFEEVDIQWCDTSRENHCEVLATTAVNGSDQRWRVEYCSGRLAIVDTEAERIVVNAHSGKVLERTARKDGFGMQIKETASGKDFVFTEPTRCAHFELKHFGRS